MAKQDIEIRFEALEQLLINRRWLGVGEVDEHADKIAATRAVEGVPLPNEVSEG